MPSSRRPPWLGLAVLVAVSLAIRLWLLPYRWVNPDEGAHLMDARLALDGLLPGVDYSARQPFYVYLLAGWLRLFGLDFFAARALMVLLDTGIGVLVYLIASRLFDRTTGLAAAGIYLLLPFSVVWAPLVHTEPLTVLLAASGVYLVVRRAQDASGAPALAGAGVCFGLAFYVRQSALALLLATALILAVAHRGRVRVIARDLCRVMAGFVAVIAVAFGVYALRLPAAELWASPANPLPFALQSLGRIGGLAAAADPDGGFRLEIQSWSRTLFYLRQVLLLASVLAAGFLLFALQLGAGALRRDRGPGSARPAASGAPDLRLAGAVLLGWVGGLALLYGYWTAHRGFYAQYFSEFTPPLAIGLGYVATSTWTAVRRGRPPLPDAVIGLAAAAAAAWLAAAPPRRGYVGRLDLVAVLVLAVTGGLATARWRSGRPAAAHLAAAGLLVLLLAFNLVESRRILGLRYQAVWSPASAREVVARIRANSGPDDEVMSGALVWEFMAGRRPFAGISHPLAFLGGMQPDERRQVEQGLATRPPRVIVLDGYTEKAYVRPSPAVARALAERYREVAEVRGSRFPIRVYVLAP